MHVTASNQFQRACITLWKLNCWYFHNIDLQAFATLCVGILMFCIDTCHKKVVFKSACPCERKKIVSYSYFSVLEIKMCVSLSNRVFILIISF